MKIVLSRHAKLRCEQRRLSEKWVTARLLKIPLSPGTHEHMLDGTNLTVIYHDGDIRRTIITLYSVIEQTEEKPKPHVDLTPVRDMLEKVNQKFNRRKKQQRKNKFKKR